jgi:tetratricopeptide (TPR) repeat protein
VAPIGRNDPCPCGSGRKYKKCCLEIHERADRERARLLSEPTTPDAADAELADLDRLSSQVVSLIRSRQLDDAERMAHELASRFPDQIDGIERLAEVYEAQGELDKAAEHYRRAAGFTVVSKGFDPEVTTMLRTRAEELETRAKDASPAD